MAIDSVEEVSAVGVKNAIYRLLGVDDDPRRESNIDCRHVCLMPRQE